MVQRYRLYGRNVIMPDEPYMYFNAIDNTIEIEIKQNKEDMKTVKVSKDDLNFLVNKIRYGILPKYVDNDKIINEVSKLFSVDDTKHSNSENIGKNLKPFNLEAVKSGKPVCTRDGRKARIICFDYKGDCGVYPILALISTTNQCGVPDEIIVKYTENGKYAKYNSTENNEDLMMLPEKKEGWVNVYKGNNGISKYNCDDIVFNTKEEAIQYEQNDDDYVTTVKISWEE